MLQKDNCFCNNPLPHEKGATRAGGEGMLNSIYKNNWRLLQAVRKQLDMQRNYSLYLTDSYSGFAAGWCHLCGAVQGQFGNLWPTSFHRTGLLRDPTPLHPNGSPSDVPSFPMFWIGYSDSSASLHVLTSSLFIWLLNLSKIGILWNKLI